MLHIHCDSRRAADPVFHITPELCAAALERLRTMQSGIFRRRWIWCLRMWSGCWMGGRF